jgi:hypothetical protein
MKKVITLLFLLTTGVSLRAQTLARYSSQDLSSATTVDRGLASSRLNRESTVDHPGFGASPQTVSPLYRQDYAAPMHITRFSIPGEKKKKVGSVMTVLGGALFVGGIAVYASGDPNYENTTYNQTTGQYETTTVDPKRVLGVLMCMAGAGVAIPGVIIWTKGIRQYNQYMREQGETGSLKLSVGNGGVGFAYHF